VNNLAFGDLQLATDQSQLVAALGCEGVFGVVVAVVNHAPIAEADLTALALEDLDIADKTTMIVSPKLGLRLLMVWGYLAGRCVQPAEDR